jgi:hypothetical protein
MPIQSYANQSDELPTILSSSISDKIIAYKGIENLGFTTIKFETNEPVVATVQVSNGTTSTSIKLSDWLKKKSQYELYFVPMNYEKAYHDQFVSLPPGKYSVSVNIVDEAYNRSIIGIGTIEILTEEKIQPLIEILDVKITNESKLSKIEPKVKFQYKVNRPAYLELPVFRDYANSYVEGERTQIDILAQSSNYLAPGIYEAEWNLRPPKRFFRNNRGVIIMQPNDRTIVPPDEYKLFFRAQEDSIKKYAFQESFGTIPDEKTIDISVALKDNNTVVQIINGWTPLFEDIQNHWAKADILFLNSKNIIKGSGNNKFYPDNNITRAEFITMLARSMNLTDNQNNTAVFTDVKSTDWYFNTVMAAANAGLVQGNDKGQFAPNALITREEIAVLSVRALEYKKVTTGASSSDMLSIFNDNSKISSWAKANCNSAVSMGLLKGKPGNLFAPKAYAIRAESAVILKRLLDQIAQ